MARKTKKGSAGESAGYSSYDPIITNSAKNLLHHPSRSVDYRNAVDLTISTIVSTVEANVRKGSITRASRPMWNNDEKHD